MTTIGIIQPNFVPWRGYFDFIREVDVFVFLDDVAYTRNDWRNRNRIRTRGGGSAWLTVPVSAPLGTPIREVALDARAPWRKKHLATIAQTYARAPHVEMALDMLGTAYARHDRLADLDIDLCGQAMAVLGIDTPLVRSSGLGQGGVKDARLIAIVRALGGTRYLSGPAAKAYLQPALWAAAGIDLAFKSYAGYPVYPQISAPFDPAVSILDLIAMTGPEAGRYLDRAPAAQAA